MRTSVGLGGVLHKAVRIGLGHDRRVIIVAHRPGRGGLTEEAQVILLIVTDGEGVVGIGARLEPAVAGAAVKFDPSALVGMIRISQAAATVVLGTARTTAQWVGAVAHIVRGVIK